MPISDALDTSFQVCWMGFWVCLAWQSHSPMPEDMSWGGQGGWDGQSAPGAKWSHWVAE